MTKDEFIYGLKACGFMILSGEIFDEKKELIKSIDDCIKRLMAKEKCMERETSGIDTECNSHNCIDCSLCYEQGTVGEQKMALVFAIDIMRKYQKIMEILNDDSYYEDYGNNAETFIVSSIREVIKEDKFHSKHCPEQPTIPPMPKGVK